LSPHNTSFLTLSQLIRDLHNATISTEGEDQSQRGTQLLEIYALEIQMYNETRNFKKLKVCTLPLS
jgi:COP9 signalosome complex subunit 2